MKKLLILFLVCAFSALSDTNAKIENLESLTGDYQGTTPVYLYDFGGYQYNDINLRVRRNGSISGFVTIFYKDTYDGNVTSTSIVPIKGKVRRVFVHSHQYKAKADLAGVFYRVDFKILKKSGKGTCVLFRSDSEGYTPFSIPKVFRNAEQGAAANP